MESLIKGGRWGSLSPYALPLVHSGAPHSLVEVWGILGVTLPAMLWTRGDASGSFVPGQSSPDRTVSLMPCEPARIPDGAGMLVPGHMPVWVDKMGRLVLMELDLSSVRGGWVVRHHAGQEKWLDLGCQVRQALELG